jgi:integrase
VQKATLDDAAIAAAFRRAAEAGERVEILDHDEQGLRLRIGSRSARWSVITRSADGRPVRLPLGSWPIVGITKARESARSAKRHLANAPSDDSGDLTLGVLLELYSKRRLDQLKRGQGVRRSLTRCLKPILAMGAADVSRRDIARAIDRIADTAPIHANRTLAYVKAFFKWAVGRGYLDSNPVQSMAKPSREVARDRTPTLGELVEIWSAASEIGYPFGSAIQLLILTAARRDEVAAMRVNEVEIDRERLVWTLPAHRSKNGRAIRTGLPEMARAILKHASDQAPAGSAFLFSTTAQTPISGWSKAKARLDDIIARRRSRADEPPMPAWRLHDLRRAFATAACDTLKIEAAVVDRCLNHVGASTASTVARVYARGELFDQRTEALARWAQLLDGEIHRRQSPCEAVVSRDADIDGRRHCAAVAEA